MLTDNDNRAASDVNLVAKKNALKSAAMNSVKFKFNKKARIDVTTLIDEEFLMELCLENQIDDYELRTTVDGCVLSPQEENHCVIYVDLKDMAVLRDVLRSKNYQLETKLASIPNDGFISVSDEDFDLNMTALDAFEALDDVDIIEHNIDMRIID